MTTDLDPTLQDLRDRKSMTLSWSERDAVAWAESFSVSASLRLSWEPGNEEFILLIDEVTTVVMLSVRYPLAFVNYDRPAAVEVEATPFAIVAMTSLESGEFRASPNLLQETLLRPGQLDDDFNPDAFSAWDLFVMAA